ncbi:DUF1801 domain-containing protein [Candidatus Saccharibacteria bacterium]|nr:DUF1801 domain-containing protein [Candidatus Saccharibacteria bacterium]
MVSVDEYLAGTSAPNREALERIRRVIKQSLPDAIEQMSYGIPGFKYQGKYLCGYAAFKNHLSFFPASNAIAELHDELAGYKLSKGTIQFTLDNQIPEPLLVKLLAVRRSEIESKK